MRQQPPALLRFNRRRLLGFGMAGLALMPVSKARAALAPTPAQTPGPFYPAVKPLDADADLVHVAGQQKPAVGIPIQLLGRVLSADGRPVAGARVEIWQCDAFGVYHHPLDTGRRGVGADPGFQGYGEARTAEDGGYRFRTIRPVAYSGRTPHIHVRVTPRDLAPLTTQMYVAGESRNETDFILARIRDPAARQRVIVPLEPLPGAMNADLVGVFDIVLDA